MPKVRGKRNLNDHSRNAQDANIFSQLTYLLHLVTYINSNDKHLSSFHKNRRTGSRGNAISKDDAFHPLNSTILDSIAAILVQQHEIVAACYTSDYVSVMVAETDPNPSTDLEVPVKSPLSAGSHRFYPLHLAAISNPNFNIIVSDNANPHNLQIQSDQSDGANLWTMVRDTCQWYFVLM